MKIIVIGAGFGGLCSAIRLLGLGHSVSLIEKQGKTGGMANTFVKDGFTFDAGPAMITAPWLIEELFTEVGKNPVEYLKFVEVDPFYKIIFPDGSCFNYTGSTELMKKEIAKFSDCDVMGYELFLKKTELIFKKGFKLIDKPLLSLKSMLAKMPDFIRFRADRSVYSFVSTFIQNEKLRRVFSFHPLLIGGNPFTTSSIYATMLYLEKHWGVWYSLGGTGKIVLALEKLFLELGGKIMYNSEVNKILIDEKSKLCNGVKLKNGDEISCDSIVSNADVAHTYRYLIDEKFRKKFSNKKITNIKYAIGLFIFYFGTNHKYNNIPQHSILLCNNHKKFIDDLFSKNVLSDELTLYLHRPTATDSSVAPHNHDAFYALAPVPHLGSNIDWNEMKNIYREKIINLLEEKYLPNLKQHIVCEHVVTPLNFKQDFNCNLGSAFSVAPTLLQSGFMRPHNKSEDIENLYFTGAGTHPGAGVAGVISSAKIVAELIGKA